MNLLGLCTTIDVFLKMCEYFSLDFSGVCKSLGSVEIIFVKVLSTVLSVFASEHSGKTKNCWDLLNFDSSD
jgi:hypothetical protein